MGAKIERKKLLKNIDMGITNDLTGLNIDFKEIPEYEGVKIITDFNKEKKGLDIKYNFTGYVIKESEYLIITKSFYIDDLMDAHNNFIEYVINKIREQ